MIGRKGAAAVLVGAALVAAGIGVLRGANGAQSGVTGVCPAESVVLSDAESSDIADSEGAQSALQMIMGGSIAEAFGVMESLGLSIMHSMFAVTLAVLPFACFLALCFDKNKHIKHIFVIIGSIVCLFVIFFTLYPHVGIGAVLSVIMYILILVLNLFSIYAKQQEDYIVAHPEEEAAFTESHPQFVKALINAKSFNRNLHLPTKQEQETQTARNVKKRQNKKKKK